MIFSSPQFIFLFLPLTLLAWSLLRRVAGGRFVSAGLVLASLIFYASWEIRYLPLLLGSVLFNFGMGKLIAGRAPSLLAAVPRRLWLTLGVLGNLGALGIYKYTDFVFANLNVAMDGQGPFLLHLTLPLGISFFTFQQIAYLADAYKDEGGDYKFIDYTLFVTFFPQLIAGPIVHHGEMMPQFTEKVDRDTHWRNMAMGMFVFGIGLCKKIILADTFSKWVGPGFDTIGALSTIRAWDAALCYTLQIYFDFSGYTDMAMGAALLFNIKLPLNFNSPYKAVNISDFWRRWHITLGRWLRDYLYIPLGGNRISPMVTARNSFTVMLLGGMWHGAGWTFIAWGILHGLALGIHMGWKRLGGTMPNFLGQAITFFFVVLVWVPFRATSMDDAFRVWDAMFVPQGLNAPIPESVPWLVAGMFVAFLMPNSMQLAGLLEGPQRFRLSLDSRWQAVSVGIMLALGCTWMMASSGTEFIYFNF